MRSKPLMSLQHVIALLLHCGIEVRKAVKVPESYFDSYKTFCYQDYSKILLLQDILNPPLGEKGKDIFKWYKNCT